MGKKRVSGRKDGKVDCVLNFSFQDCLIFVLTKAVKLGRWESGGRESRYPLKYRIADRWRWRQAKDGQFSTKEVYDFIAKLGDLDDNNEMHEEAFSILWKKFAPIKVVVHG
ncbi:hypothetical protein ACS0TY_021175 [Phlomoides rotata]